MGVHKNAEHESGYFEDEEEDEEVARTVICVNSSRDVVGDKSDENLAGISCCEGRVDPHRKSKYEAFYELRVISGVTCHGGACLCRLSAQAEI
jgi:hypothetical protein